MQGLQPSASCLFLYDERLREVMVYSCPSESDPRDKLESFVTDPEFKTIAGLKTDGMQVLIDLVKAEVQRLEPDSEVIYLDREELSDNRIDFPKDLMAYFEKKTASGKKMNFLMTDDIPIVNWSAALKALEGRNAQVYCFSVACRQIPACSKML